jgi:hypothetical protein
MNGALKMQNKMLKEMAVRLLQLRKMIILRATRSLSLPLLTLIMFLLKISMA